MSPLHILADGFVVLVILIHVYIVVLEMLLWTSPFGRKTFGLTEDFAKQTRVLAANQGLYNAFLAAGLIWGVVFAKFDVTIFFLACVIIAGLFGGLTASRRILFVQALPAAVAWGLVWLSR